MRSTLSLCLIALLLVAANAFAGAEARLNGTVIDSVTKQPVTEAVVKLEATSGKTVKRDSKVAKDGTWAIFVLDGTLKYKLTISAPGYVTYEEPLKLKIGDRNERNIELIKGGVTAGVSAAPKAATVDPAVALYNEGAQLANAGQNAEAIAKFEAAAAAKESFTAAWAALAKTQLKVKSYAKAIEAANKALETDNEDIDMWAVLAESYAATGDKAKAADARKHVPASASQLFNDAAKAINASNDAEAEKLLKQALAVDDKFAPAYYELGMLYARATKNADAKAALEKYLEIDPNGKDAATAKDMLKYLK